MEIKRTREAAAVGGTKAQDAAASIISDLRALRLSKESPAKQLTAYRSIVERAKDLPVPQQWQVTREALSTLANIEFVAKITDAPTRLFTRIAERISQAFGASAPAAFFATGAPGKDGKDAMPDNVERLVATLARSAKLDDAVASLSSLPVPPGKKLTAWGGAAFRINTPKLATVLLDASRGHEARTWRTGEPGVPEIPKGAEPEYADFSLKVRGNADGSNTLLLKQTEQFGNGRNREATFDVTPAEASLIMKAVDPFAAPDRLAEQLRRSWSWLS